MAGYVLCERGKHSIITLTTDATTTQGEDTLNLMHQRANSVLCQICALCDGAASCFFLWKMANPIDIFHSRTTFTDTLESFIHELKL
jgi:hypothetical protein